MKRKLIALMITFSMCTNIMYGFASKDDVGTTSLAFLKMGVGARGIGMGGAYTAATDDVNSVYWNPAGLMNLQNDQVAFMHTVWFEDISYDYAAYAHPRSKDVFAASVYYLSMDSIQKVDNTGTRLNESYSPRDLMFAFSYARKITKFSLGANVKYVRSDISEVGTAYALDAGMQYPVNDKITCGAVMQNISSGITYLHETCPLPFAIKGGVAMKMHQDAVRVACDLTIPNDNSMSLQVGGEYNLGKDLYYFTPRMGLRTDRSDLTGLAGITIGMGMEYKKVGIDYAWVPYGDLLGSTHQLSLILKFGNQDNASTSSNDETTAQDQEKQRKKELAEQERLFKKQQREEEEQRRANMTPEERKAEKAKKAEEARILKEEKLKQKQSLREQQAAEKLQRTEEKAKQKKALDEQKAADKQKTDEEKRVQAEEKAKQKKALDEQKAADKQKTDEEKRVQAEEKAKQKKALDEQKAADKQKTDEEKRLKAEEKAKQKKALDEQKALEKQKRAEEKAAKKAQAAEETNKDTTTPTPTQ